MEPLQVLPENFSIARISPPDEEIKERCLYISKLLKEFNELATRDEAGMSFLLRNVLMAVSSGSQRYDLQMGTSRRKVDYEYQTASIYLETTFKSYGKIHSLDKFNLDFLIATNNRFKDFDGRFKPRGLRGVPAWVGGTGNSRQGARIIMLPPEYIKGFMVEALEVFKAHDGLHPLLKIAIFYAHFIFIHPFCNGNGRTIRVLLPKLFCLKTLCPLPIISLNHYLEVNRPLVASSLNEIIESGEWGDWFTYFLDAVEEVILNGNDFFREIDENRNAIESLAPSPAIGKALFRCFVHEPICNQGSIFNSFGLLSKNVRPFLSELINAGILSEITRNGKKHYIHIELTKLIYFDGAESILNINAPP